MSVNFEVKRTIKASQQPVYSSLFDLDAARNWMQGFVRIERLDDAPVQVGSKWLETRKMFGKEATEHFEVVELNGTDKIVLRCDGTKGTTGKGEFVFTYTLVSSGEETEVTLNGEINGLTGLTKLFGKLMVGTFSKACAKDLDALKSYLENGKNEYTLNQSFKG
ncbi:SRPBCC family protein [Niallia endozanthoxylica]|uniref:Polyketide cyclase / dehydrase and lipid transport n=1 Tax=Niallia endozanthoxylica TaxID=2036016 RepID=A0A5J5I5S4_9BACI|nr:SRPBCC family protein [Niallia endozanthoxylica]KAA9031575.1 polyketide cyclase / dehydrase and lipid transport [Niallia endozanthoxylica]